MHRGRETGARVHLAFLGARKRRGRVAGGQARANALPRAAKPSAATPLDALALQAILPEVELRRLTVPAAQHDHAVVRVLVVALRDEELVLVDVLQHLLHERRSVRLEHLLFRLVLDLLQQLLHVAADVRHVQRLVVRCLGVPVVVHHVHNALLSLCDFTRRTLRSVLVHVGRDAIVLATNVDVAAVHHVHDIALHVERAVIVADNLGAGQHILKDLHGDGRGGEEKVGRKKSE
ncbi:ige-dependent histamine-releasing factor, putative [Leishmania tarentolae]|uniref:Ige-dependent histamine-releasing factor, putative n=1 Tax=Leishmania tarentolae TaxID=5689 RepID=A0A640KI66_LEITA|nr:ige-dependent histamine-releasing factor, putative [Leishmania tarentolae]